MGVHDLDARFGAVNTTPGTIAHDLVGTLHEVAKGINDRVVGEPYQWVAVLQQLEVSAHQAARLLNFPADDQPGTPPADPEDPAPAEDAYEGMTVEALETQIRKRNKAGAEIPVSGTKAELVARLHENDRG